MSESRTLTDLQVSILRVLWRGEASTQDVHRALADRGLAVTTVATLLSRLEKRGVLSHRSEGRQYIYRPLVSESDVRRSMVSGLADTLFGGDAKALLSHLVSSDEMSAGDLAKIRGMIEDAEADARGRADD